MRRWKINSLIAAVLLIWSLWPVACLVFASMVADWVDVPLDDGGPHRTMIHGVDYGEPLYDLSGMGWFGLITLPTGALGFLIFAIIATVEWRVSVHRKRKAADPV